MNANVSQASRRRGCRAAGFGSGPARQRGVALVVGLIVLVVVTLIVVNAFVLSSTNLKAVNNMQIREESIAAANHAVEQLIVTNFAGVTVNTNVGVDLDKDGNNDYTVVIAPPLCTRAVQGGGAAPSETELPALAAAGTWATDWDITANVEHAASGARVTIRQGIRIQMSDTQKAAACP